MAKKTNNTPPLKNYIYVFIMFIGIILLSYYILSWYSVKKNQNLANSYLLSTSTINLEIKNLTEVSSVLKETPNNYFIFINYLNDEKNYKLEKSLKKIIDSYSLSDEFYYLNITEIKDNENILKDLNNSFKTNEITNIPCILFYKDSKLESVVQKEGIFTAKDFQNILNANEYTKIN